MNSIEFKEEDALEYYFKVSDNDAVNGAKTSRSRNFEIKAHNKEIKIAIINDSIKRIKRNYYNSRSKKVENLIKNIEKTRV